MFDLESLRDKKYEAFVNIFQKWRGGRELGPFAGTNSSERD